MVLAHNIQYINMLDIQNACIASETVKLISENYFQKNLRS